MSTLLQKIKNVQLWMIAGVLLVILVGLVKSLIGFSQTSERFERAQAEVEKLKEEKIELESQLTLKDQDFVMEEQLRNSLGLSREGEKIMIIPDELLEKTIEQRRKPEETDAKVPNWKKWLALFQ